MFHGPLLILLLCGLVSCNITVTRSVRQNVSVLGDTLSYGVFEIDFHDPNLFYYADNGPCTALPTDGSCAPQLIPGTTCPCDYTDTTYDFCSPSYNRSNHPCNCPKADSSFCAQMGRPGSQFIRMQPGQTQTYKDGNNTAVMFFAYNTNCQGYILRIYSDSYESRPKTIGLPSNTPNLTGVPNPRSVVVCPGDYLWGKTASMLLLTNDCCMLGSTTVRLETRVLPPARSPTTCSPPTELSSHICVPPGQTFSFAGVITQKTLLRFVVPVESDCGTLLFTSSASLFKLSFTDPWTYPANSSDGIQTRQYGYQDAPGLFGYCFTTSPEFGNQHYIYGWVYASPTDTMFFDTNNEWTKLRPISEITAWDYPALLQGAVTIQCGSKSFTQWSGNAYDVSTINDGFANVRFVWPQEDPHPFYPPLPYSTSWQWKGFITNPLDMTPRPGKLAIAVVLDQRINPTPQRLPNQASYQFLSTTEFQSCKIIFNGLIANSSGPIFDEIDSEFIEDESTTCNQTQFQNSRANIGELLSQSDRDDPAPTVGEQSEIGYLIDLQVRSRDWYLCTEAIDYFFEVQPTTLTIQTDRCTAPFGSPEFGDDPCCIYAIGTPQYRECILDYRIVQQQEVQVILDHVHHYYPELTECRVQSLELLNDLQNREKNPTISCSYTDKTDYDKHRLNAWYSCFYPAFGIDPAYAGLPCRHDSECSDFGICTAATKTCALNQTKQGLQFLNCVIGKYRALDPYILLTTCDQLGVNCTESETTTRDDVALSIFTALNTSTGCSYNYWLNYDGNDFDIQPPGSWVTTGACASCPTLSINYTFSLNEAVRPWDCIEPNLPTCTMATVVGSDTCGSGICNYNHIGFRSMCAAGYFCGICDEGGASCLKVSDATSTDVCPSEYCLLPNNTVLELDNVTCKATWGCTDGNSTVEAECLTTGSCSDATDPIYGIFRQAYSAYPGACVVEILYNHGLGLGKSICLDPFRPSVIGCLNYQVTQTECEDPTHDFGFDPLFYSVRGIRWVTKATTKQECDAYGTMCTNTPQATLYPSTWMDVTFNATFDCDKKNVFVWTPASWYPGQPRNGSGPVAQQYDRQGLPGFSSTVPAVWSIRKLWSLFNQQAEDHFSLIVQSESFCRIAEKKQILDDLFCGAGNKCYPQVEGFVTTQLGVACSQDTTPIKAYPLTIIPTESSLPPGSCQVIRFGTMSITSFQDSTPITISTTLLSPSEDTKWTIRNVNGAIFGKVLTDGVGVQSDPTLKNVTLCIPWNTRNADFRDALSRFPVYDIGVLHDDYGVHELLPIAKAVRFDNVTFCAEQLDLRYNSTYFFIMRYAGTPEYIASLERDPWTDGETAYISVILALYCIGLTITLLGFLVSLMHEFYIEIYLIFITLIVFWIFRIVLFGLALGSPYSLSHPAVGYLLVEFPLILFFAFVSLFIITWSIIIRKGLDAESTKKWVRASRVLAITFLIIVFGFFILLIILFNTLVQPPTLHCRGSIVVYDSDTAFALGMAYRATFSTFAFLLGICLAFVGSAIIRIMLDVDLMIPFWTQLKVILATVFGTFGLFAQAIYYLVITATRGYHQSTYLSLSILLVDEIVPALFFMACVVTLPSPKSMISSFRSRSKTKSGSKGSKGSTTGGVTVGSNTVKD